MKTAGNLGKSVGWRQKAAGLLRRLRQNTRGQTMAMVGLAAIPLVGSVGVGLDVGQWVLWKRQLHTAADAGALAGALAKSDSRNIDTAVRRALTHNDLRNFTIVSIESPPSSGSFAGDTDAVRVVLSAQEQLAFSSMFLGTAPVMSVEAVAISGYEAPNCVVALDTTGVGITISGSATVNMNCALASNSNLEATSSDSINAAALSAVGAVNAGSGVTGTTKVNDGVGLIPDPFSDLPEPNVNGSCSPNTVISGGGSQTIGPGCYKGLKSTGGTLTLQPGTYYIGEQGIAVSGGAAIVGSDVTLIYTNTSNTFNSGKIGTFDAAGSATVQLSAPSTGVYAGVVMYQDPRTPTKNNTALHVTGNSGSSFQGTIYGPSVEVKFTGNSSMTTPCLQIVALYASFEGNTSITNNCPSGVGSSSFGGFSVLRLVK